MKLCKSIFFTIAICMMQPVLARVAKSRTSRSAKTPAKTVPARTRASVPVALAGNTFQSFMHQVRNMKSENVIDNQGVFTDTFKNFVQATNLAPFGMEMLMQAGRNLHLPLSRDSKQDIALTVHAGKNITNFMAAQLAGVIPPTLPSNIPQPKPAPIAQAPQPPIINPINKPEDPYDYAELIKNQFSEQLKTFFIKKDENTFEFGNKTNQFPSFVMNITSLMRREYPQISLKDLIGSVTIISLPDVRSISNGTQLLNYIKEIVTNEYNVLQQQTPAQPQPQAQALLQKSISSAQLKDVVIQNLIQIDQQKSIDYLFTENSGNNFWYIKIPASKDSQQTQLAYGDTLLLIDKLVKILRDKYPDYISLKSRDTSLNVVLKAIEEGLKDFLQQKYNKKFQDYDDAIIEYLSTHNRFEKIMSQKSQ